MRAVRPWPSGSQPTLSRAKTLLTGAAGFIGSHVAQALEAAGHEWSVSTCRRC
ncbi:NAD-dependent epimerase/dehydratase family protein [Streptosporangium sp. NPDC002544]|uniref:NAD-dependent epimerase/dehydratase family protein n=1 Tax=Streptosporangium sp. NPDC002544 TaxID=3154538 RepID=UPI003325BF01